MLSGSTVALCAAALATATPTEPPSPGFAQQVTNALAAVGPGVRIAGRPVELLPIEELMSRNRVPALSLAILRDGRVVYARALGVADRGTGAAVTVDHLFQAASVSKPVVATAALALADRGKLRLDAPVNDQLSSWTLPDSDKGAASEVTVRRILGHGAGLSVHGFGGYAEGAEVPTLTQLLDGAKPANSDAVRIILRPGTEWKYSGGGYQLLHQLIEDVSGAALPEVMDSLVLKPAGMTNSHFRVPAAADAKVASGHLGDGDTISGRFHRYPELAAAGLWTNPTELARWMTAISDSYRGRPDALLAPATAKAMLTPGLGEFGLGMPVKSVGTSLRFSHSGSNEGFRALLVGDATSGNGFVLMANSDNGAALFGPVNLALAPLLGWTDIKPHTITPAAVTAAQMRSVSGEYRGPVAVTVTAERGRLFGSQDGGIRFELIPLGKDAFFAPDIGVRIQFVRGPGNGPVTELIGGGGLRLKKAQ